MKVSACIELVWKLAAQEAIAGEFKEIEPDHFFAGLLKFAELPVDNHVLENAPPVRELASEIAAVREVMGHLVKDTTRLRRDLRSKLGKGGIPFDGSQIHRSSTSREAFDSAAQLADIAGSQTLTSAHLLAALLASPTPLMIELLGATPAGKAGKSISTPLLNEIGKDLTKMAGDGALPEIPGRQAECRMLLRALALKGRKSVLLVSDNHAHVQSVVCEAARVIGSKTASP